MFLKGTSISHKFYYTLNLNYDGANYFGWQRQKGFPTIQQTILNTLEQQFPLEHFQLIGASRTDARVHALDQYAQLISTKQFEIEELIAHFQQYLPPDIKVKQLVKSHAKFMVIYSVKSKSYFYLFNFGKQLDQHDHVVHFQEELNYEQMQQATNYFIGTHSFHNFQYKMNPNNTTIRTVTHCQLIKNPTYAPIPCYSLEIAASGFLKQMVRIIMGTLINIGQELHTPQEIWSAFHPESCKKLGFIAPANGLHLQKIEYR